MKIYTQQLMDSKLRFMKIVLMDVLSQLAYSGA